MGHCQGSRTSPAPQVATVPCSSQLSAATPGIPLALSLPESPLGSRPGADFQPNHSSPCRQKTCGGGARQNRNSRNAPVRSRAVPGGEFPANGPQGWIPRDAEVGDKPGSYSWLLPESCHTFSCSKESPSRGSVSFQRKCLFPEEKAPWEWSLVHAEPRALCRRLEVSTAQTTLWSV